MAHLYWFPLWQEWARVDTPIKGSLYLQSSTKGMWWYGKQAALQPLWEEAWHQNTVLKCLAGLFSGSFPWMSAAASSSHWSPWDLDLNKLWVLQPLSGTGRRAFHLWLQRSRLHPSCPGGLRVFSHLPKQPKGSNLSPCLTSSFPSFGFETRQGSQLFAVLCTDHGRLGHVSLHAVTIYMTTNGSMPSPYKLKWKKIP